MSNRIIIILQCLLLFCIVISIEGHSQQSLSDRIALVIGVQNYTSVQPLKHALNDATDMASTLKDKGFKVDLLLDPKSSQEIKGAINRYFNSITKGAVGVIYYSGHGTVYQGSNFLIPASAKLETPADVNDQCVKIDFVIDNLSHSENLNILILDACRTNTFPSFSRDIAGGLASVEPPKGTIILFATQPGKVASDGTERNGLFTSKLLKYIDEPRLNILDVLKKVKQDVLTESNGQQLPSYVDNSLGGDFYFTEDDNSVSKKKTANSDGQHASNQLVSNSISNKLSYESPVFSSSTDPNLRIQKVTIDNQNTIINFQYTSTTESGVRLASPNSDGALFIKTGGKVYKLISINGIGNTFTTVYPNKPANFSATFESLPKSTTQFDLIEGKTGSWHFFGVRLGESKADGDTHSTAFEFGTCNDYGYGTNDARTILLGTQEWMAKNLNVDHFANGDPIPQVKTIEDWRQAGANKQPAWCYYNFDPANGPKYGKLYNWFAVDDPRGLAPNGWHVPSDEEWKTLTSYFGGYHLAGAFLKDTNGWRNSGDSKTKGNNFSGFSAVSGGHIKDFEKSFLDIGKFGRWWSSTQATVTFCGIARQLAFDSNEVDIEFAVNKNDGLSVRCVKDK